MNSCNLATGFLVSCSLLFGAQPEKQREQFQEAYLRWHQAIAENPELSHPFFFQTQGGPVELVAAVKGIQTNGLSMAGFLCEKLASQEIPKERLYADVLLLEKVTGIDLFHAEDKPPRDQNIRTNMVIFTARFREEWRQGVYKDPGARIARLCAERLGKETATAIEPNDVVGLRRYGIFGVPEMIRQIRKTNSKHAFAAYLIVTGQGEKYGDYIVETDKQFTTKEEKLAHIEKTLEKLKKNNGGSIDILQKISAALETKN